MKQTADIAVYSPDDRLKQIVEVKSYKNATDEWAAELRRNLFVDGFIPTSEFFPSSVP